MVIEWWLYGHYMVIEWWFTVTWWFNGDFFGWIGRCFTINNTDFMGFHGISWWLNETWWGYFAKWSFSELMGIPSRHYSFSTKSWSNFGWFGGTGNCEPWYDSIIHIENATESLAPTVSQEIIYKWWIFGQFFPEIKLKRESAPWCIQFCVSEHIFAGCRSGCVWKWAKPLNPMVLLIRQSLLNGYFVGNIPNIFRQTHLAFSCRL